MLHYRVKPMPDPYHKGKMVYRVCGPYGMIVGTYDTRGEANKVRNDHAKHAKHMRESG